MKSTLDDEVLSFLSARIDSYEELEVLLLMRREPDPRWTAESVAQKLGVDEATVERAFANLHAHDLIAPAGPTNGPKKAHEYDYRPVPPLLDRTVAKVVRACDESRIAILRILNSNAIDRVRTSAMHAFADAFVLGKGGKKDG